MVENSAYGAHVQYSMENNPVYETKIIEGNSHKTEKQVPVPVYVTVDIVAWIQNRPKLLVVYANIEQKF